MVKIQLPKTGQFSLAVDISISGFDKGDIVSGDTIDLTLSGGTWSAAPSWSGSPSIGAVTGVGTQTLSFTALADSTANTALVLTGAAIDLPADTATVRLSLANGGETWTSTTLTTSANTARIAGADRYATAVALFDTPGFLRPDVVLTSGVNYPDALSAAFLARQLSTGILTTDPNSLSAATRQLIVRESVRNHLGRHEGGSLRNRAAARLDGRHRHTATRRQRPHRDGGDGRDVEDGRHPCRRVIDRPAPLGFLRVGRVSRAW
jgi:hypothetical protein